MKKSEPSRNAFLVKTEPDSYSFEQLEREGMTVWNGVRNAEARKNLRAMQRGDIVYVYHSGKAPALVGLAKVTREAYPEPGAEQWSVVEISPVRRLERSISLAELRQIQALSDWALIRRSRLSVVPVSSQQLACLQKLESQPERTKTDRATHVK